MTHGRDHLRNRESLRVGGNQRPPQRSWSCQQDLNGRG
jgi:hypothetical protein